MLGPQIDLGRIGLASMPPWTIDLLNAVLKLGPDERLIIAMPRQSGSPRPVTEVVHACQQAALEKTR